MSEKNYVKLYDASYPPQEAFFLSEGSVYFFITESDKYAVRGKNLIIGASEIILSSILGIPTERLETAVAEKDASVKRMSLEKFLEGIKNFSFIINVAIVLAKQVFLTNEIINKNLNCLDGGGKKSRDVCVEFYQIVSFVKREYEKRKLPWLKEIVVKYENSLSFKRGEAMGRASEPTRIQTGEALADKYREFPTNSIICEEGSEGDEMYILESGSIDIFIRDNRVATVSDKGAVFGEMALLLGDKRTATLKAKNNVVLTVIKKTDLKEIAQKEESFFLNIAASLAKKHHSNNEKIKSVNKLIINQAIEGDPSQKEKNLAEYQKSSGELLAIKRDVENLYNKKDADFLKQLVEGFD